MKIERQRRLVGVDGLSEYLGGKSNHTIRSWVRLKRVPFLRAGRGLLFDLDEIDRWLDENGCVPSKAAAAAPSGAAARAIATRIMDEVEGR